jgi:hypothetical protein
VHTLQYAQMAIRQKDAAIFHGATLSLQNPVVWRVSRKHGPVCTLGGLAGF